MSEFVSEGQAHESIQESIRQEYSPESVQSFLQSLTKLPHSYEGSRKIQAAPYSVEGLGEGLMATALLGETNSAAEGGTFFLLTSGEYHTLSDMAAEIARAKEQIPFVISTILDDKAEENIAQLVPEGVTSTYHFVQAVLYATNRAELAAENDRCFAEIAALCEPSHEQNPARDLAWKIWNRIPLLIPEEGSEVLTLAWQGLLARVAKVPSIPVQGDTLAVLSGMFEGRHEFSDGKLALLLDADEGENSSFSMRITAELLKTRTDEVIAIPCPVHTSHSINKRLSFWYFGLWVAAYLAQCYEQDPHDHPVWAQVKEVLSSER